MDIRSAAKKLQLIGFAQRVHKIAINRNRLSNKTEDLSKDLVFLSQSVCFSLSAKVTLLEEQSLDCL